MSAETVHTLVAHKAVQILKTKGGDCLAELPSNISQTTK